ncbi:MAG TPA: hypothetical protein VGJ33_11975 [Candidatus Angelobacter sp.]
MLNKQTLTSTWMQKNPENTKWADVALSQLINKYGAIRKRELGEVLSSPALHLRTIVISQDKITQREK